MKKDKVSVSPPAKRRRKRWTRDDTELTLLGLPAVVWYALFCYLPMFGLIIAFKNFKLVPGKGFCTACSTATGWDLITSSSS